MDALIPLLLIFIALNSKQLSKDKLYRANVFAIVGILYFVFLQYLHYWNRIFHVEGAARYIPILIAVLMAVGACLSPWARRSQVIKTTNLCILFVVLLTSTYMFDVSIKEWLAEKGGFYSSRLTVPLASGADDHNGSIEFHSVGLEMKAFDGWVKAELPSGHKYLLYEKDPGHRIEVRPNCMGEMQVDTPTYVSKILQSYESGRRNVSSSYECGGSADLKMCLVKATYPSETQGVQRWHWFAEQGSNMGFTVDYILSGDDKALEDKVMELMVSTRIVEKRTALMCRTPAAWL
ncbi:hypothetical protein [uncultured Microbulbifer sp.]|uniref:hypothetical protein n=1 Tax=uncultured Microbulbifer sp. TaxID=348147 RepID=UPI002612DEB2|nr:hypothetical protein [uncultured Microbulbifer sp.]